MRGIGANIKTIAANLKGNATVGDAVEMPWPRLERDLQLHTKELALVAGAPGAGKSVFALNVGMALDAPVLYLAQDSAPSVFARVAALALGEEISYIYDSMRHAERKQKIVDQLEDAYPDLFIHAGALTVESMEARLIALEEVLGTAPQLVIIDNLIDTIVPGHHHQEIGFYASSLNELKQMAIKHNTCIMALHHVTRRGGESSNPHGLGTRALKMTDLLYSGEREAEHVLGVYHSADKKQLFVQVLKQRDGDADPEGGLEVGLVWHAGLGKLGQG